MAYFTQDYIDFFKELAANNHKDWFHENKKRYQKEVKKAFENFTADAISIAQKLDPKINPEVKYTQFRINRDIRFSKNKAPYNLHKSAIISPKGRKDSAYPGFYVQINADSMWLGGGAYMLDKDQLQDIRYSLIDHPGELQKILNKKSFKEFYGELRGERYKVLPKEFKEAAEKEPLLFQKQFYFMAELPVKHILSDDLMKLVEKHFRTGHELNQYLIKAMYH